jgi:hypothetical protein
MTRHVKIFVMQQPGKPALPDDSFSRLAPKSELYKEPTTATIELPQRSFPSERSSNMPTWSRYHQTLETI